MYDILYDILLDLIAVMRFAPLHPAEPVLLLWYYLVDVLA